MTPNLSSSGSSDQKLKLSKETRKIQSESCCGVKSVGTGCSGSCAQLEGDGKGKDGEEDTRELAKAAIPAVLSVTCSETAATAYADTRTGESCISRKDNGGTDGRAFFPLR